MFEPKYLVYNQVFYCLFNLFLVFSETAWLELFITLDTVAIETPASLATSSIEYDIILPQPKYDHLNHIAQYLYQPLIN